MIQIQPMNSIFRHIVMEGKSLRAAIIAAAMLMLTSVTAMAQQDDPQQGDSPQGEQQGEGQGDQQQGEGQGNQTQTTGVIVGGNVYGGGNLADVLVNATVSISTGRVEGNVYGGGNLGYVGKITKSADYNYTWTKTDGTTPNTHYNNEINGTNTNTGICTVEMTGGTIGIDNPTDKTKHGNVFGAGKGLGDTWWCEKAMVFATDVSITAGTVKGNVYGGGEIGRVEDDAKVTIGAQSGKDNLTITGDVFGAGAGIETHGYSALVRGNADVTVQGKAHVGGSVYGGGEIASVGRFKVIGGLPSKPQSGGTCKVAVKDEAAITGNVFGACKGLESKYVQDNYKSFCSMQTFAIGTKDKDGNDLAENTYWNYYEPDHTFIWRYYPTEAEYLVFLKTLALTSNTEVAIAGDAIVNGSVFGGGELGITLGNSTVDMLGGTVNHNVFGGGSLADTNTTMWDAANNQLHDYAQLEDLIPGLTRVTGYYKKDGNDYRLTEDVMAQSGHTYYAVYKTTVNLLGGTIGCDAYGGGLGRKSFAGTPYTQAELDANHQTYQQGDEGYIAEGDYKEQPYSEIEAKVYGDVKVNLNGMTVGDYSSAPATLTDVLQSTAINGNGNTDQNKNPILTDADEDYHVVTSKGCIVNRVFGCNDLKGSPQGNVTVHVFATQNKNASKATIGAYYVSKRDIDETLQSTTATVDQLKVILADQIAVAKEISVATATYETLYANGNATADDFKTNIPKLTKAINDAIEADGTKKAAVNALRYDLSAVYGGGNEAAYEPATPYHPTSAATGSKVQVIIDGCEYTSIETVYGGGNAAPAPETNVAVHAAYEIGTVFGGGNGKDAKESDGSANEGADIGTLDQGSTTYGTGNANTLITGGYIHEAYGGSNERGTIMGSINLVTDAISPCPMLVEKMVTAGKNADIMGDAITILGCMPESWVDEYYGGADNANVHGNVELTITSGNFHKVFGGNNKGGIIMGHIKVNIEETGCRPIVIDELYLGGNQAAYSYYGYYVKTKKDEDGNTITDDDGNPELDLTEEGKLTFEPRTSATDSHPAVKRMFKGPEDYHEYSGSTGDDPFVHYDKQPELNIISCTRIGKVFGGGLGETAVMYADPTVNINQIYGTPGGVTSSTLGEIGGEYEDEDGETVSGGVYGGGNAADVIGNPTVNIGTEEHVYVVKTDVTGSVSSFYTYNEASYTAASGTAEAGTTYYQKIGEVYDEVKIAAGTTIGEGIYTRSSEAGYTAATGNAVAGTTYYEQKDVLGANIAGNVYGGGKGSADNFYCEKAMIGKDGDGIDNPDGGTTVNIYNGTVSGNVYGGGEVGRVEKNTVVTIGHGEGVDETVLTNTPTSAPVIMGNVFGGGAGVNTHGYSALVRGNPTVLIEGNAKVKGSVYGGGEIASVARYQVVNGVPVALAEDANGNKTGYCTVTVQGYAEIGPDGMQMYHADNEGNIATDDKPDDWGHVFAAGKGILPKTYVFENFTAENRKNYPKRMMAYSKYEIVDGKPKGRHKDEEEHIYWDYSDTEKQNVWEYFHTEKDYFDFIETLALATQTELTIGGHAFVKGSAYGGSENGTVQFNTDVTIQDHCQIGQGQEITTRYEDYTGGSLFDSTTPPVKDDTGSTPVYYDLECAHWDYGKDTNNDGTKDLFAPYDPNANATGDLDKYPVVGSATAKSTEGGRRIASDGHTYYGNVFGGGSGSVPYFDTNQGISRYIMTAGQVKGNTNVTIKGGHILTNVYGGCEATNVLGDATVTMEGGTLGVPRTLAQIDAHPVTCYLFGAGKGDQRVFFNKDTNVKDVEVEITGGKIFGSVFGGGEDGHVLGNITMTISDPVEVDDDEQPLDDDKQIHTIIGNYGTSYVDGNVFGGGRGFGGDAYTAGNVGGSVTMTISGGSILGSVYGGGRLGSVGYDLLDATTTDGDPTPGYGEMQPDNTVEASNPTSATNFKRGYIDITISGGIIGNDHEYLYVAPNTSADDLAILKTNNYMPNTEFELVKDANDNDVYRLKHTKGGNVFAGGMGRRKKLNGDVIGSAAGDIDWTKLGNVKQTKLKITGGLIKSNVYGGGELGAVIYANGSTTEGGKTEIEISGTAEIGTVITEAVTTGTGESAQTNYEPRYTFGSVYGAGMGSEDDTSTETKIGGRVEGSTKIDMKGGTVRASVYGGGELAVVQGSHIVKDSNGDPILDSENKQISVGTEVNISGTAKVGYDEDGFGGATMGNVYGAGKGSLNTKEAGLIKKNTLISISGTPNIYHNIYGGGAYGSVGTFTYETPTGSTQPASTPSGCTEGTGTAWVTITGGTFGINGHENGMVFGSSRGDVAVPDATTGEDPNNKLAWVSNTYITIGTTNSNQQTNPWIKGSVYGSGENGHVLNNTNVAIHSGKIGIEESDGSTYDITSGSTTYKGAEYGTRGNVYGGGCGTDTYDVTTGTGDNAVTKHYFNRSAGVVRGNATITMDGGKVVRSIYGGGAMGSVGRFTRSAKASDDPYYSDSHVPGFISSCAANTGLCSITISGGQVGTSDTTIPDGAGNVFGASRGEIHDATLYPNLDRMACVDNTEVSISGTATIKGSVYGGGETGDVLDNTEVNVCAEYDEENETYAVSTVSGTPTIGGNVYGGGKGIANSFECAKAMVGLVNDGVTITGTSPNETYTLKDGGTTVRIYNGTVGTLVGATGSQTLKAGTGNVYGGGEIARVERNTVVEIGAATGTTAPVIRGSVFAAGAGKATHGYSALVRGHSTVTVQGSAQVLENVYGGGELASVGRYKVKTPANAGQADVPSTLLLGMPARLLAGGTSTVNIQGSAIIGDGNANTGHVYGAGQGLVPSYTYTAYTENTPYATRITNSKRMVAYTSAEAHPTDKRYKEWDYYVDDNNNEDTRYVWEYFPTKDAYLQFVETLALSAETFVTIGGKRDEATGNVTTFGTPTVKGSVFGGSESGFVYKNTDVKILRGTVHGDAFGGGLGLESFAEAGRVRWNTNLAVSGTAKVEGNVYGGGKLGDVGTINKDDQTDHNYIWKNTDANGNNLAVSNNDYNYENSLGNNTVTGTNKNTGICTVAISGGTIGIDNPSDATKHGNVFGAGQGSWHTWWCEKAIVYATDVSVSGGTVKGNVYGGGEVGRVEDDAKVTIGTSEETEANTPNITGGVFGGGAGLQTHGYSALVRGNSEVTVQGKSKVGGNVYGGGEIASVGRFKVDKGLPTKPKGGGTCTVIVKDNAVTGDVYGSCKGVTPVYVASGTDRSKSMQLYGNRPIQKDSNGNAVTNEAGDEVLKGVSWDYYEPDHRFIWRYYTEEEYLAFLPTLGLASNTHVTIGGSSTVNGSVYGGGQRGVTLGGVDVNITGGTVGEDVYGGGALANTNSSHWHNGQRTEYVELTELLKGSPVKGYYTAQSANALITADTPADDQATYYAIFKTNVNLTGGTINNNVYGGGLGQLAKDAVGISGQEGYVPAVSAVEAKVYGDVTVKLNETTATDNCEVKGSIFGCNNLNGSPQNNVTVHVSKTVTKSVNEGNEVVNPKPTKETDTYELKAVYGGGNLAAFHPDGATTSSTAKANVIIDGCDLTSIQSVYGGGNAASVPATEVVINGTYEIGEAFGGGNGKDDVSYDGGTTYVPNPGANVGYLAYTDDSDKASKAYGSGKTHITIYGGTVHEVYGGSNTKGNVRVESRTTLEDGLVCTYDVGEAYGGGHNAPQDGDAVLEIGCISGMEKAYGGAANADVNGNVVLNITNGTYGQVFGGNDAGGAIRGSITVNIEETGCRPIIIGELYCGGCDAGYSVYGYETGEDGKPHPLTELPSGGTRQPDPVLNVKSFTSIGNIFGGGYGADAVMVGDPQVNINVLKGKYSSSNTKPYYPSSYQYDPTTKCYKKRIGGDEGYDVLIPAKDIPGDNNTVTVNNVIGAIYNVYGGGNAANVIGTPHVNVGTMVGEPIYLMSKPIEDVEGKTSADADWIPTYEMATVEGVDIRGNVFGGGNAAEVTGDTKVVIGKNNNVKTYSFTSYSAETDGTVWSSGLAQTTGVTKNDLAEVEILSNGKYPEFIGQKFYVSPTATADGTTRTELKNESGSSLTTPLYVAIRPFEKKTYNFTSYGAATNGTQYSTGTAAPTGNFKVFSDGKDYMQIEVLTNPEFTEWEGRTYYVPADAKTDGTRYQLRKTNGDLENVWVTISLPVANTGSGSSGSGNGGSGARTDASDDSNGGGN